MTCSVDGCTREAGTHDMCRLHRRRRENGGNLTAPIVEQRPAEWWDQYRGDIQFRFLSGETQAAIAQDYGVSATTIGKQLRRWETPKRARVIPHGRPSAWQHHGCRCEICEPARQEYRRQERMKRLAEPVTAECGTKLAYSQGCECDACAEAMRTYLRERNAETRKTARNHGKRWTGAEAEVAMRDDLSIIEKAKMLGRTYSSIDNFIRTYNRRPDDPYGVRRR